VLHIIESQKGLGNNESGVQRGLGGIKGPVAALYRNKQYGNDPAANLVMTLQF
jgi:hypothetical protein